MGDSDIVEEENGMKLDTVRDNYEKLYEKLLKLSLKEWIV